METLVIVESWFGNTREIAEAVASGIREHRGRVSLTDIAAAPPRVPDRVSLLLVGAPTHNRGLSTAKTRATANEAREGSAPEPGPGVREWLESVALPQGLRIGLFDTATGGGWLSGSAAKQGAKILARRGLGRRFETRSFSVRGLRGPLTAGQVATAHQWGRQLAETDGSRTRG